MSFSGKFGEELENLRRTHAEGRLAHAYLIAGSPRGDGLAFAEALLQLVFCSAKEPPCNECDPCRRLRAHAHPDVEFVEPESKGRVIRVDEQMRPLLQRLTQTSYLGGWKAGVILYADRLNDSSGNAFLKTLEEPPPRTLLLLVSDQPQSVLTTLRSRCQLVTVSASEAEPEGEWKAALMGLLKAGCGASVVDRLRYGAAIRGLLEQVRAGATEEAGDEGEGTPEGEASVDDDVVKARAQSQVLRVRGDMLRLAALWHRDVLACTYGVADSALHFSTEAADLRAQAGRLRPDEALDNVRLIEELNRRLERGILDTPAMDRFVLDLRVR